MSHADPGPLAAYNSLQDKHLAGYFSNSRMKKHLKKSGLVTKKGKIIDEKTYRLNMAKKEHRKHVRDLLATAIVHKTLDMERIRQYKIRKELDEAYKVELVRRVKTKEPELKEGRNRKGDEDILPLLSPRERTAKQMRKAHLRERPATAPATFAEHGEEEETHLKPSEIYYDDETQKIYYRVDSSPQHMNSYLKDETEELGPSPYTRAYPATYPAPAPPPSGTPRRTRTLSTQRKGVRLQRFHYLARTEPAVARRVQLQSMAEVTMKFLGPSLVLTNSMFPEDRLSEVMVLQQHCGGSTLCVFRELLPPNTIFTFISRRHRGAPFGLTFYIDGMQDIRLSSCCEYKHKPGHILGGKNGHFQFVVVEGAAPCYRCQIASAHKHSKYKHKNTEGSGDVEDDDRSKTFMTETANEQEEEQGETFDVIITKIQSAGGEDGEEEIDSGEMVDHSTQTPRDESANKQEELDVDGEKTAGSADSVYSESKQDDDSAEAEESGADKYDDEEFEEGPEKDKENESESEAKEETDEEGDDDKKEDEKDDDYNEDFESDEEKERDKSGVEDEDGKESEKEEDDIQDETEEKEKSENELRPEDDIEDETEDKEKSEIELRPEDDIEDETEEKEKSEIELRPEDDIEDETEDKEKSEKELHPEDDIEDETEEKEKSEIELRPEDDIEDETEEKEKGEIELRPEDDIEDETEDKEKSEKELHPEDDIEDETEDTEKSEIGEKEQAEEVEDQTDKEKPDNAGRPTSATDSEGRKSKNVSFDEDVTVIEDEQEEGEKDDEENREDALEEVAEQNDQEDPSVDKAEQESEDLPEKVPSEFPRQGQDDSRYREEEQHDTVRSPEPSDSRSSSSSSGSESSDSDDESKRARRSKKKRKGKSKSRPGQDPGSDPDLVSSGQLPDQALKAVGVQPGTKHDGSIQSLLEGKEDVELVGVALTKGQFEEVAKIIDSREDLGTVILRNTSADDSALETLAASLINAPTLKMLNLSVNRIGPEGAKHLAGVIRQNKSLRMLLLHGNPLTDEGVGIIIDAIVETTDTSIMNLDLGDSGLTQDGAKHIAKLIKHNSTVTVLTISGNTIPLEGWQNISKALLTNSTLETLSLDFNKIGDEEAISIAEGIQGCKSLRSVDLEGNKIGDEGGRKLFDAVKANKSIVDLTLLPINQISKEIVDEVKDFLKEREKGNEPEEVGGGEEQHETEFSALQPQQDSGGQGLVTEGDSTEASLEEIVNEYTSIQENNEEGQEQREKDGVIIEVDQSEEPPGIVQKEQGREEKDKEAEDREQPSGGDQQSEKEDSAVEENAAPAEGVGQLPDAEHPEHQDVPPAKDDQDGNEPQQDSHQAPQPDPHSDPKLVPQQDPQQSENGEGQESSRKEQPQILEDPGESTGQELLGQDKEDKSPQDPAVSVDLGVNDDEETSKRVSSTKEEGNDNKQEALENEIEDEQVPGASSPGEDAQNNSSDPAS